MSTEQGFSRQDYLKTRKRSKGKKILLAVMLLFMVSMAVVLIGEVMNDKSLRPKHCDDVGCVKAEVFEDLPDYPMDFEDKKVMVMTGKMMDLDRIDEAYWKQPEFYENSFESQCLQYYTGKSNVRFSAGSGGYPADMVIKNASQGDVFKAMTYWHAGCGIYRYQAFGLEQMIPSKMSVRMSDIKVVQDPKIAEDCFDVKISPEIILLTPTHPEYTYNWTQQVDAEITVSDTCPSGVYGIQYIPSALPDKVNTDLLMKYGASKLSSMYVGGVWQIAIEVI